MTYSWSFLAVAVVLILTPGADFALIVRNTVTGGRAAGTATTIGISTAAAIQGFLVATGLASVITRAEPLFLAIKWVGVAYLVWLAITMIVSAIRGVYPPATTTRQTYRGFRQGFLCNSTNPKILIFYLALLPQFVDPQAPIATWLLHAWTLPVLGAAWCLGVVTFVDFFKRHLARRPVRRLLDAAAASAMLTALGGLLQTHIRQAPA